MAQRLILDTGVLIASERSRRTLAAAIAEDDDLVIAAVTVAELRTGVELATERHHAARSREITPPGRGKAPGAGSAGGLPLVITCC